MEIPIMLLVGLILVAIVSREKSTAQHEIALAIFVLWCFFNIIWSLTVK